MILAYNMWAKNMPLKSHYDRVTTDWKGELYAGINLEWNYEKKMS